jgi:hypothetical protein
VQKLIGRLDPIETVTTQKNYFSHLDVVDLREEGFKIAFGMMSLTTKEPLEDTDFV